VSLTLTFLSRQVKQALDRPGTPTMLIPSSEIFFHVTTRPARIVGMVRSLQLPCATFYGVHVRQGVVWRVGEPTPWLDPSPVGAQERYQGATVDVCTWSRPL
jgi:hypothetical protein